MDTTKKGCMTSIPSEVIEKILLRLPVSTLLRCLPVCKQWFNIIRDPHFATAHLQQAPRCNLLFFTKDSISAKAYPSDVVLYDEAWSSSTLAYPVVGPDDFLCASCNGLVCCYTKGTSTIKIANLATGECLHLAKSTKHLKNDHFTHYSFGFHPVTKEYKVVHFLRKRLRYAGGDSNVIRVYRLGDENWRDIIAPSSPWVEKLEIVNVDGAMYWLIENGGSGWKYAVMSFDLKDENFVLVQPPPIHPDEIEPLHPLLGSRHFRITEIHGKVCMAITEIRRHLLGGFNGILQIWALENKAEQRWSQHYCIQLPSFYTVGPHFVHDNKIMIQDRDKNIFCHELSSKNFKIDRNKVARLLNFCPRRETSMLSFVYVKSLVRLDVYKRASIVRSPKRLDWWELKRWGEWSREITMLDALWNNVYRVEHDVEGLGQRVGVDSRKMFRHPPDQQTRSLRRCSWFRQRQDKTALKARLKKIKDILKALIQIAGVDPSTTISHLPCQGSSG